MKSLWKLRVPLILGLSLPFLAGCSRPPGASEPQRTGSGGSDSDLGRAAFRSIPLPPNGTPGAAPLEVAREVFGSAEPVEGNYVEEAESLVASEDQQVVVFTRMGLADDSVLGMRYRLELIRQGEQWEPTWAGQQTLCRPGRGHQDWSAEPCL